MKVSTEIGSAARLVGYERAIELAGKAGFDAWDLSIHPMAIWDRNNNNFFDTGTPIFSSDYKSYFKELRKIGEAYGMVCNQSHAPFPVRVMSDDLLKRAIECTAIVGGEICIIHPDNDKDAEANAERYLGLLPFAKSMGVKIATENMWNWYRGDETSSPAACSLAEDFVRHIDAVADPYFVACLDIGHAEMRGSGDGAARAVRMLGKRLAALHVHDNDRLHDSHLMPFTADIDFCEVANSLSEIGYSGYVTLEADSHFKTYDEEHVLDGFIALERSARRFAEMIK